MKKFFFLAVVAMMSLVANAQQLKASKNAGKTAVVGMNHAPAKASGIAGTNIWGYYLGDNINDFSGVGPGSAGTFRVAIKVPGTGVLAGTKIRGINIPAIAAMTNVSAWCATGLRASSIIETKNVASTSIGFNTVEFDNPVEIPASGLYVGYTFSSTAGYPIAFTGAETAGGLFLALSATDDLEDYSFGGFGVSGIQVFVEGMVLPDNGVRISKTSCNGAAMGSECKFVVDVASDSNNGASTIGYSIVVNGIETTGTANVDIPAGLGKKGQFEATFTAPNELGTIPGYIAITTVNGQPNELSTEPVTFSVYTVTREVPHITVVEEFTGTECPWCSRGWAGMEAVKNRRNENGLVIAWHRYNSTDPMYQEYYVSSIFSGASPECVIDRKALGVDPYWGDNDTEDGILKTVDDYSKIVPTVAIKNLRANFVDDTNKKVNITSDTEFLANTTGYTTAYVLTVDGLTGTTTSWKQANNYATYTADEAGVIKNIPELADFCKGGKYGRSSVQLVYNDVMIGSTYDTNGKTLVPAFTTGQAGDIERKEYILSMPTKTTLLNAIDYNNIYVTAIVCDENGSIVNAYRTKVEKTSTDEGSPVEFISPDGREYLDGETMTILPKIDPDFGDITFEAPSVWNKGSQAVDVKLGINITSLPSNTSVQECFGRNCYIFDKTGTHDTEVVNIAAGGKKSTATEWNCYDATIDDFASGTCTIEFTLFVNGTKDKTIKVNYTNDYVDKSFHLNATTKNLKKGESFVLEAYYNRDGKKNNNVTWSSTNTNVATIDLDGKVTAKSEGTAYIKATSKEDINLSATCIITVYMQKVESLNINPKNISLFEGEQAQLEAIINPQDAENKVLEWYTSNSNVVLVTNTGLITAVKEGNATITAKATDGSNVTATCNVTVKPILAQSILLNETNLSLDPGNTYQLEVTILPENTSNKTVVWSSSNSYIASVSSEGLVTAKSFGNVEITANTIDGSNLSATCYISVSPILTTALEITPSVVKILEGENEQLSLIFTPQNATYKDVIWTIADNTIASVSSSGLLTGLKVGRTYAIARTTDGSNISATCEVNVYPVLATSITLSEYTKEIVIGNTYQLNATVLPYNATTKEVVWQSADNSIATVNNGLVTGIGVGKTTITATTTDGTNICAECEISVLPLVAESLTISRSSAEIFVGDEFDLVATIYPSNTTYKDIIWNSSNDEIVSVDNGHVVGHIPGEATVSVRTTDGSNLIAYCNVVVNQISVQQIVFSEKNYSISEGETLVLEYTISPDNATYPELTWESNDELVAVVSEGVVSAISQGVAIITAKATDGSGVSGMCAVVVTAPSGIWNVEFMSNIEGIYTLNGQKVEKMHHGIYIIRMNDGTSKTISIK